MKAKKLKRPKTQPEINKFRRESLIAATLKVVAEHGIENATFAKIGEEANVSSGLAPHYFSSKDELLMQAYQNLLDQVFDVTAKAAAEHRNEPVKQIKAIIAVIFGKDLFGPIPRAAYLRFWTASLSNPQLLAINQKSYVMEVDAMEHLFARAAAATGKKINARRAALGLICTMDGLWLDMSLSVDDLTVKIAVEICCEYVDMILG